MKNLIVFVVAVVAIVIAKPHVPQAPEYHAPAALEDNRGPDSSNFQYNVPVYDAKTYGNADVNVERFPGGVNYQVNENAQGSDVRISVQTSATGQQLPKPSGNY